LLVERETVYGVLPNKPRCSRELSNVRVEDRFKSSGSDLYERPEVDFNGEQFEERGDDADDTPHITFEGRTRRSERLTLVSPRTALTTHVQEIFKPEIKEGATKHTLDTRTSKFKKTERMFTIELYNPKIGTVAKAYDMTPGALRKELERNRRDVFMKQEFAHFDLSRLEDYQLETIRQRAGVYALLPPKNQNVELYRFPSAGERRGSERQDAIGFEMSALLNYLIGTATSKEAQTPEMDRDVMAVAGTPPLR